MDITMLLQGNCLCGLGLLQQFPHKGEMLLEQVRAKWVSCSFFSSFE